jgi:hypothetical protein
MRVYVAGPMRGIPLFNFPAFDHAAKALRDQGHEVFSPAERDREDGFDETIVREVTNAEYRAFLKKDLPIVLDCEAMYMLRGWSQSTGASLERHTGRAVGNSLWYQP